MIVLNEYLSRKKTFLFVFLFFAEIRILKIHLTHLCVLLFSSWGAFDISFCSQQPPGIFLRTAESICEMGLENTSFIKKSSPPRPVGGVAVPKRLKKGEERERKEEREKRREKKSKK